MLTEAGSIEVTEEDSVDDDDGDEKLARQSIPFEVDWHCGSCEERVKTTLDVLDGDRKVHTGTAAQRVGIRFNPHQINAEQLRRTATELGYTTAMVEMAPPDDDRSLPHSTQQLILEMSRRNA